MFSDNVAHSTLEGVMQISPNGHTPCTLLHGFRTWRNYDWGIFTMIAGSLQVQDHISIDDTIGLYPFIYRPPSASHQYENKYVQVTDSHYVGFSSASQCDDSQLLRSSEFSTFMSFSSQSRGWKTKTGIAMGSFCSGPVPIPIKPFLKFMAYQAIRGKTTVSGRPSAAIPRSQADHPPQDGCLTCRGCVQV